MLQACKICWHWFIAEIKILTQIKSNKDYTIHVHVGVEFWRPKCMSLSWWQGAMRGDWTWCISWWLVDEVMVITRRKLLLCNYIMAKSCFTHIYIVNCMYFWVNCFFLFKQQKIMHKFLCLPTRNNKLFRLCSTNLRCTAFPL